MDSLRGQLLLPPPQMNDPNFSRTVVLIIHHDPEGAFGVVLNRPTERTLEEVWREVRDTPCPSSARLHVGGPVAGPLLGLHAEADLADEQVIEGVFCSTDATRLDRLVQRNPRPQRWYVGYAGWGGGQLEMELQTASWLTVPAARDDVFDEHQEDLWERLFTRAVDERTWDLGGLGDLPRPGDN